ncbi:hypothetical protein ACJRO7_019826 [Eucalyptus globulus]|uniref:CSN8/PSMD8/EIF3K domain-containing protein n=1 Tax=Eucalyptus globulus TaxID=34317 RepID=A0ABD3KF88_EUCGL
METLCLKKCFGVCVEEFIHIKAVLWRLNNYIRYLLECRSISSGRLRLTSAKTLPPHFSLVLNEHAVIISVKMEDQDAFDGRIPPSPQEYPSLGLNLLRLLVQNGIAEFYTKHAVELEQSFMEGAYNRFLSARQTVRHETYVYFMDLLAETVRDEIASCSEKAYDYLSISDARANKAKESAPSKEIPSPQLTNQTLSYARELERIV